MLNLNDEKKKQGCKRRTSDRSRAEQTSRRRICRSEYGLLCCVYVVVVVVVCCCLFVVVCLLLFVVVCLLFVCCSYLEEIYKTLWQERLFATSQRFLTAIYRSPGLKCVLNIIIIIFRC